MAKKATKALTDLQQLIELGQKDWVKGLNSILGESVFNSYRQDPRFRQIFELAEE